MGVSAGCAMAYSVCSRFGLLTAHLVGLGLQLLFDDLLVNIVRVRVATILHVLVLNKEGGVGGRGGVEQVQTTDRNHLIICLGLYCLYTERVLRSYA